MAPDDHPAPAPTSARCTATRCADGAALCIHQVSLAYDGTAVVHEVDAHVRDGRITVFIGPNGSGKSTLMRSMSGLHGCADGTIALDGSPLSDLGARERARRLTLLAQNRPTPAGFTVRDVVGFGRHPHRAPLTGRDDDGPRAIAEALEVTGLADLADRPVETLSGGQVQRVWLASCLAQDTRILLLDEPANHLDLRYQVDLLRLIRHLARDRGLAVGVVLHDLQQSAVIADEIVLLSEGRVVAAGAPADVLTPERLLDVYGVEVHVARDAATGLLRVETLPALADLAEREDTHPAAVAPGVTAA
ncbi:ABC transporter ATP-binding protein [Brachybacterium sp. AOP25-B2-12]|uniref:ABC transporter ATP-binding protein n=1 Tax=Brachybacterium sp. AOP25-B2-12 TaxID=3457710 RepID=UPI004034467D